MQLRQFYATFFFAELTGICDAHLINEGLTMDGQTATIQLQGTGPFPETRITEFRCSIDDGDFFSCKQIDNQDGYSSYW